MTKFVKRLTSISSFINKLQNAFTKEEPIMDYEEMIDQEKMSLFESIYSHNDSSEAIGFYC